MSNDFGRLSRDGIPPTEPGTVLKGRGHARNPIPIASQQEHFPEEPVQEGPQLPEPRSRDRDPRQEVRQLLEGNRVNDRAAAHILAPALAPAPGVDANASADVEVEASHTLQYEEPHNVDIQPIFDEPSEGDKSLNEGASLRTAEEEQIAPDTPLFAAGENATEPDEDQQHDEQRDKGAGPDKAQADPATQENEPSFQYRYPFAEVEQLIRQMRMIPGS